MPHIDQQTAYAKFQQFGRNSSHFVWFLCDMKYFETSQGWIFGYVQKGSVTVFALEPLIPSSDAAIVADEYHRAWREFDEEVKTKIVLYVSVFL